MKKTAPVLFISSLLTMLALFVAPLASGGIHRKRHNQCNWPCVRRCLRRCKRQGNHESPTMAQSTLSTLMVRLNEQQRTAPVGTLTTRRAGTTHWNPRWPPSATATLHFPTPLPTMAGYLRAAWQMRRRAKTLLPLTKLRTTSPSRPTAADM